MDEWENFCRQGTRSKLIVKNAGGAWAYGNYAGKKAVTRTVPAGESTRQEHLYYECKVKLDAGRNIYVQMVKVVV